MFRNATLTVALASSVLLLSTPAGAQSEGVVPPLDTIRVGVGYSRPLFVTAPPGDYSRIFVVEQRGIPAAGAARIMIIDITTNPPTQLGTPFLTISAGTTGVNVTTGNEQGLLGMAFDPNYATNGRFYVNYTASGGGGGGHTRISRFTVSANPNIANNTEQVLLTFDQPESNHNGGWIGFGPDGYLYIATGDGGGANDQHTSVNCPSGGNGQCLNTLLGKMLRIDVSGAGAYTVPADNPFTGAAAPFNTIWAYGLRNPFRDSFDRGTGALYIGDVGQNAIEEISYQPPTVGGSMGGRNYGWRCMEGNNCTGLSGCTCNGPTLQLPITTYSHSLGRCSVTGGYVYRGSAIPGLHGTYFFADYCGAQIYTIEYMGVNNPPVTDRTAELAPGGGLAINTITSFGEDAAGEIYIVDQGGEIFKIIPSPPANDSCVNAPLIVAGAHAVNTVSATTDGPDEPGCNFNGYSQIGNDVWFKFAAQCTGTAVASICDATFNTKIAAYSGCPTAPGQVLACNDDDCGTGSRIAFHVDKGNLYQIRVGGYLGATGTGTMNIVCGPPGPCPEDVDGSGSVDVNDLLAVIAAWGPCPAPCPEDIDNSGNVDVNDLLAVISGWGPCL